MRTLPAFGDVLELRVTLLHIEPPIWRALRVPAWAPLAVLHEALQVAFGWEDCHLHDFLIGDVRVGMLDPDHDQLCVDEHAAPVGAVARVGAAFVYRYDFGDDWEHQVVVTRMESTLDETIRCISGERAGPPEDCGGPAGYENLLEALANPRHERHADLKEWLPRKFDPERFDLAAVNRKLGTLSKRAARWRKVGQRR